MKIGRFEITQGPNIMWMLVTAMMFIPIVGHGNWWPLIAWFGFNLLLVAVCVPLHFWSRRRDRELADAFPLDPFIQKKYGYRSYTGEEMDRWYERNIKDRQ